MTRAPVRALAVLCLAALASVAAADEAVPFDAKKAKAFVDRDRAWLDAASRAAYRTSGRRSPKWDADVDAALKANLDRVYGPFWDRPAAEARLKAALQFAADDGCDDP